MAAEFVERYKDYRHLSWVLVPFVFSHIVTGHQFACKVGIKIRRRECA
jgi:hypothetical protein